MPRAATVAAVSPAAERWFSLLTDESDPGAGWTHLFAERGRLSDPRWAQLLRMVADEHAAGVIIADVELRWLYAPYDGRTVGPRRHL